MLLWKWAAAALIVMLLAACTAIVPPTGGAVPPDGTVPPESEEPAGAIPAGLTGVTWEWQSTQAADGTTEAAADPSRYTLMFNEDGTVSVQFDCNSGGGSYTLEGDKLTFGPMMTTLMGCPEDSQVDAFSEGLNTVASVALDGDSLTLGLSDGGEMLFRAAGAAGEVTAGEAMTTENPLVGVTWQWTETQFGDGSILTVSDPTRYTLTFQPDGSLQAQVDCNRGMGSYTLDGQSLTIGPLATTRMACPEDSQANDFAKGLEIVATFVFDGPNLVLNMKFDSGNMYFAPAE